MTLSIQQKSNFITNNKMDLKTKSIGSTFRRGSKGIAHAGLNFRRTEHSSIQAPPVQVRL
jgi:hypothetical protein